MEVRAGCFTTCTLNNRSKKCKTNDLPPRILFLDIDGVLACARSQLFDFEDGDKTLIHHPDDKFPPLEVRCVAQLRRIQQTTGCCIVLSTSWRMDNDMRKYITMILHRELGDGVVVGCTPILRAQGRGAEIRSWLGANKPTREWCILDDQHKHAFARAGLIRIINPSPFHKPNLIPHLTLENEHKKRQRKQWLGQQ